MTSIAQISENEQREIEGTLKKFFSDYRVRDLLKACRAEKQKGHSAFEIFRYLLCLVSVICCALSSATVACTCRS